MCLLSLIHSPFGVVGVGAGVTAVVTAVVGAVVTGGAGVGDGVEAAVYKCVLLEFPIIQFIKSMP